MHHILQTSKFTPLIHAAQAALTVLHEGYVHADTPAALAKCSAAANRLQGALNESIVAIDDAVRTDSPFLRYRVEILGMYGTAYRLQALVLHLFNSGHSMRLSDLLINADEHHRRIALELIASYASHGENDPQFMALAAEIFDRRKAADREAEAEAQALAA